MVSTIIVAAVVLVGLYFGFRRMGRGLKGTQSCCGEMAGQHKVKKVTVTDTDEANYPYHEDLMIGGMSCEGCAENVTNAMNGVDGTWASVDLKSKMAHVRSKKPVDEHTYDDVVKAAGYYVVHA